MNKEVFLNELRQKLSGLPEDEIDEQISFYSEMIDDRMEDGVAEADAIAEIGTADEIAEQIMSEIPLTRIVRKKVASGRKSAAGKKAVSGEELTSGNAGKPRKTWKTVLLIVGAVVWVPLLIAFLAVIFSLYIALWAVVISLWALFLALAASAVACVPGAVLLLANGHPLTVLAAIGLAALGAGLAILMFFACLAISRGVVTLTKKLVYKLKSAFIRKDA